MTILAALAFLILCIVCWYAVERHPTTRYDADDNRETSIAVDLVETAA